MKPPEAIPTTNTLPEFDSIPNIFEMQPTHAIRTLSQNNIGEHVKNN